jgi:hypothetical protein
MFFHHEVKITASTCIKVLAVFLHHLCDLNFILSQPKGLWV